MNYIEVTIVNDVSNSFFLLRMRRKHFLPLEPETRRLRQLEAQFYFLDVAVEPPFAVGEMKPGGYESQTLFLIPQI